jgi:hypothetical protein
LGGRDALPNLAREVSADNNWKDIAEDEKDRLLTQLCESKANKKTSKVTCTSLANDIEGMMSQLNAEVSFY